MWALQSRMGGVMCNVRSFGRSHGIPETVCLNALLVAFYAIALSERYGVPPVTNRLAVLAPPAWFALD